MDTLSEPTTLLEKIAQQLLLKAGQENQTNSGHYISDELLSSLYVVFQQTLLHALDLVDKKHITLYSSPSGRQVHTVRASTGNKVYTCLLSSNYCSCPSFVYTVILKGDTLMCKHMLASHLASALNCVHCEQLSDVELAQLLGRDSNTSSVEPELYT